MSRFTEKPDKFSKDLIAGKMEDPRGFIALDGVIEGLRGDVRKYLSISQLHQLSARHPQMELAPIDELESAREANGQLARALAEMQARAEDAEAKLDRIAGLVRDGFRVQKIMGRPRKDAE